MTNVVTDVVLLVKGTASASGGGPIVIMAPSKSNAISPTEYGSVTRVDKCGRGHMNKITTHGENSENTATIGGGKTNGTGNHPGREFASL